MKSSKKSRILSYVFFTVGVLTLLGSIIIIIGSKTIDVQSMVMWFISSALWMICGIILFRSSKVLKEKEDSKQKINAFNYGKRKNLHKKVK